MPVFPSPARPRRAALAQVLGLLVPVLLLAACASGADRSDASQSQGARIAERAIEAQGGGVLSNDSLYRIVNDQPASLRD